MILLLTTLALLNQAPAPPETAIEKAALTLKKAEMFLVGPYGLPRRDKPRPVSEGEQALLTILKSKDAAAKLQQLSKDATPAGKLYALLGLKHADRKAFGDLYGSLKDSSVPVSSIGGCIHYRKPASRFAADINSGLYDRWIAPKEPAPPAGP